MDNNNQELNNVETIDFNDNVQQNNVEPIASVNNNVEQVPEANVVVESGIQVEQNVSNPVVNDPVASPTNPSIPVDDINNSIPTEVPNNPQADTLNEIKPEQKSEEIVEKKGKNNSLLPLMLLFAFLMAFIFLLPTISKYFTGI